MCGLIFPHHGIDHIHLRTVTDREHHNCDGKVWGGDDSGCNIEVQGNTPLHCTAYCGGTGETVGSCQKVQHFIVAGDQDRCSTIKKGHHGWMLQKFSSSKDVTSKLSKIQKLSLFQIHISNLFSISVEIWNDRNRWNYINREYKGRISQFRFIWSTLSRNGI